MCMIDDGEYCTLIRHTWHVAKKHHKCTECYRQIRPGEKYLVETTVYEGRREGHKICAHCNVVRDWLMAECGGWLYGGIEEDIRGHAYEGYGMAVRRLAVGMGRYWARKNGELLPIPKMPITSH